MTKPKRSLLQGWNIAWISKLLKPQKISVQLADGFNGKSGSERERADLSSLALKLTSR
jgi:hypothetical protein